MMKKNLLILFFAVISVFAWGQIGSFPSISDGFEGRTMGTVTSALNQGTQYSDWILNNSSSATAVINSTGGRSGSYYVNYASTSTGTRRISSPTVQAASSGGFQASTSYVIQYYYRTAGVSSFGTSINLDGTTNWTTPETVGALASTSGAWVKRTVLLTTNAGTSPTGISATSSRYGHIQFRSNASMGTGASIDIDDVVVYQGSAADTTAPGVPSALTFTSQTSNGITLNWTAPTGGVDGGGYVVVRSNSNTAITPNANGIYATGNTISGGTIIYQGANTTFTDSGLTSGNTYYYTVFAVDKAFNYSTALTGTYNHVVVAAPTISALGATSVCPGGTFTVTGSDFTGVSSVKIGTNAASSFTVDSSTQITVTAGSGNVGTNQTVTVTNSGGSATSTATITVNPAVTYGSVATLSSSLINHLVISQIYGGGGNASATYNRDFVEIYNPTNSTISLSNYSIQYAATTGTTWTSTGALSGTIGPGKYYLISMFAANGTTGANLPTPDFTVGANIDMGTSNGKLAIVNGTTLLSGSCPTTVVDFVGYGTANCYEGTGAATTPNSSSKSAIRNNSGCADTNDNFNDFSVSSTVTPRNSATAAFNGCSTSTDLETICSGTTPSSISVSGETGDTSFTYQWYSNSGLQSAPTGSNTTGWTLIGSANSSTYAPSSVSAPTTFACFVTPNTNTCGTGTWASGIRKVDVFATTTPTITPSPSGSVCPNTSVVYTTEAGMTNYSWTIPGTVNTDYSITAGSVTSNTVTVKWLTSGSKVVGISYNNLNGCFSTNTVTTTVYPRPTAVVSGDVTICSGSNATVSVALTGTGPWNLTYSDGFTPTTVTATTPSFTFTVSPTSTKIYTVTALSDALCTAQDVNITGKALVIVNTPSSPVTITTTPTNGTICNGDVATLTADASTSNQEIVAGVNNNVGSTFSETPYRIATVTGSGAKIQYLITKAELNSYGISGPTTINSLGFNVIDASTGSVSNYAISIGNTSLTSLSATVDSSTLTGVYLNANYTITTGINYHNFSTPFVWDGTSNLLINICHDGMNSANQVKVVVGTPAQSSTVSKTATLASNVCSSIGAGNSGTNRPIFYFKYTQQPAITWSPTTDLYTDVAASTPYTGANAATVYAKPSANATYTASASLGGSCAITNSVTINVNPTTAITTQPTSATYCKDATAASLNVVATGTGTLTYQWYSNTSSSVTNSTLLTGETNSSYTPSTSTAGTTYYYVIVSGGCGAPVTSDIVYVTVDPASVAGTVSAGSSSVCSGSGTNLTLNGYTGNIQWQSSTDNNTFTNISGETSATYNTGNLTSTTYYRAVVTSGSCTSAITSSIAVTVDEPITFANLQWPSSGQICDNSTFTAYGQVYKNGVTPGAGAGAGITVEFGYNTSNTNPNTWTNWSSATYNSDSGSNDEYKYTFAPPASGTYYYTFRYKVGNCDWVYGGYNGGFWNGTSNVSGLLTVDPTAVVGTINSSANSVCSGTSTTLTLTGYTGSIQWQSSPDNNSFTNISGANSSTYTTLGLTSTTYYRAVVSSGSCTSATSTSIMISVDQPITYANLQWWEDTPGHKPSNIIIGNSITAYGQVYKSGVTDTGSPGSGITVEFGYSTVNAATVADFATANWTWTAAQFNSDYYNNDEYKYAFTPAVPGTYYFTFRYKTGNCDWVYGGYSGGFWNGSSNVSGTVTVVPNVAIWQSGAWQYGITPSATVDAIIRGTYDAGNNGGTFDFTAKTLTIDNGYTVDIPSGHAITVVGALTNNGSLTVESGANLLQTNDSATNTGSIAVKRNFVYSSARDQYNFVTSPTVNFNIKYMYPEITAPTSSNPYTGYYNESNKYFYISSGAYIAGRALEIKEPGTAYVSASNSDAKFTGVPFNGTLSYALAYTDSSHGYNLVGNPYPSNLDLDALYAANNTAISSSFLFWDNTTNTISGQLGSGYTGNSYAVYNALNQTSTPASHSGVSSSKVPTNIISVAQGFMVQAIASGKSLNYNNGMRTANAYGATFFGKAAPKYDRYWLNLNTPANLVNTLAVVYFNGGNNGFTQDDSKLVALTSDAVYSLAGTEKVLINGRSSFDSSDVVNLGSNHYASGAYTFSLGNKEGVFATGQDIYLKDLATGTVTNLSQGNYTFNASAGEIAGRFQIVYQPDSTLGVSNTSSTDLQIYRSGESFVVASSGQKITGIEVYDFSGRMVKSLKANDNKVTIDAKFMVGGSYIIRVNRNGNITTKKVLK